MAVFLSRKLKPSEEKSCADLLLGLGLAEPEPKMRSDYVRSSRTCGQHFPRDKSVPVSSAVYGCINSPRIHRGMEDWAIHGAGSLEVEAIALPLAAGQTAPRVLALIFPDC